MLDHLLEITGLGNDLSNILFADALNVEASCEDYLRVRMAYCISGEVNTEKKLAELFSLEEEGGTIYHLLELLKSQEIVVYSRTSIEHVLFKHDLEKDFIVLNQNLSYFLLLIIC